MRFAPLLRTLTRGDAVGRVRALRSAGAAVDVAVVGSALRNGVLQDLVRTPVDTDGLAAQRGWDAALLSPYLEVLAAHRLVRRRGGRWSATRRGRRAVEDDVVGAVYEAFSDYHTGLYREIDAVLTGRVRRDDIEQKGELIARLSRAMDEFVLSELRTQVRDLPGGRLLDVGCGGGGNLVGALAAAPTMTAVGVETDAGAAALARHAVLEAGLEGRVEIAHSDIDDFLSEHRDWRYDVVLVANVIYYLPVARQAALLGRLAAHLAPGGRLLVVTTALTGDAFSRHFDLLLRAQAGEMELPELESLCEQLRQAGLTVDPPRRLTPGEPLMLVAGRRIA